MPEKAILVAAFSKDIALELEKRFTDADPTSPTFGKRLFPHIEAKTLHSIGYQCVRAYRDGIKVAFNSDRADGLADRVCGKTAPDAIKKLVSKLHTKGREIAPHATKLGDLTELAIRFECEPDDQWISAGWTTERVERMALDAMELASDIKSGDTIDGSDMIFLPVRNGWLTKRWNGIVIDEAQDMTAAQLEIAVGSLIEGGRICVVGDNRQAIFAFRGADSDSLDRLKTELNAGELGLKTTYRCGQVIVARCAELVPDFEAGLDNPLGIERWLGIGKLVGEAGPGDFILSRVNAPLVSIAMQLLRSGKRARVAGRDIGKGLIALIRKFKARSVPDLLGRIEGWRDREVSRVRTQMDKATNGRRAAFQAKMDGIADQADMLISLAEGAKNVEEVTTRIEALFTDDGLGAAGVITCSSVHKAKGLEAERVFVLADTLRSTNEEELNIQYVAYSRAKNELVHVFAPKEQA